LAQAETLYGIRFYSETQVATRLTTLNHYLPYLPGTAQSFTEDEMKEMLVDMHSPAYHHLMARVHYDVDAHSYLEITQYLQNLGLIEDSFNKRETRSIINKAIANPRLIRPINTKRNTVRINAGSIRTMIIHGLTVLITQRVRIVGATRMPPITTTTTGTRTKSRKRKPECLT
jgi:hypothetical protein